MPIPHRTVAVGTVTLHVLTFADRRPGPNAPNSQACEMVFQSHVQRLLFGNEPLGTTGAMYRLLVRAGVADRSLTLRRSTLAAANVTDAEFEELKSYLHSGFRVLTLIPTSALRVALTAYGATEESEMLMEAFGWARPAAWDSLEEDGSEDGGGGSEDDGSEDGSGGSEDGGSGSGGSGNPLTEPAASDTAPPPPPPPPPPPAIEAQLAAFERFRLSTVNRARKGKAVAPRTVQEDKRNVLHFLKWLRLEKRARNPTLGVFASPQLGAAVQAFMEAKERSCSWARIANILASLVAAARFALSAADAKAAGTAAAPVSRAGLQQLQHLHAQALSEARQAAKFSTATPPKAFLDFEQCQRARLAAERALAGCDDDVLTRTRHVALLRVLTGAPPDRVAIVRTLKLGGTLKATADGYQLDVSQPGLHKTSAWFGPTCSTFVPSVSRAIAALVEADGLGEGECLFHGGDRTVPLNPTQFGLLVKSIFQEYAGIALCPKDARASFVSWLRDGDGHGDEVLASAAQALRHSSQMQASAAYDKHKASRTVGAAARVVDAYAARYA